LNRDNIEELLDRAGVLKHPCDLDVLLFFARHPRALVASEQLASWLGYDLPRIANSLEVLLGAAILKRTQHRAHAARLYVFATRGPGDGWFPELLALASTRPGRLAIREAMWRRASANTRAPGTPGTGQRGASPPRPFVVRRRSVGTSKTKAG